MKKAVIYVRVSTEEQFEKGYSIDSQIDQCHKKALELGYVKEEVLTIQDHVTGAKLDREGINQLRDLISNDDTKPSTVIIYDPDRLARNLTSQLIITDEIVKSGVKLEFVNFEWKNTPEGMMYYQLRGIFSQYEREKIRERTIRGRMQKIKKHGKLSYDPRLYGYSFNTKEDVLEVNPDEAAIVQLMFQWSSEGISGEQIAKRLSERGVSAPRGNKWYGSTVTRILRNESYLGTYMAYKVDYHQGYKRKRDKEEQFPIPIEPIIDSKTFAMAQETLLKNRTSTGRPAKHNYLLSGKGKCFCGRSMVASVKSGNRKYTYYSCVGKHKTVYDSETGNAEKACSSLYWNSTIVDEVVWEYVKKVISNPEEVLDQYLHDQHHNQEHIKTLEKEIVLLNKKKNEVEAKKNRLLDLYLSEGIDKKLFEQKFQPLDQSLQEVNRRIKDIEKQQLTLHIDKDEMLGKMSYLEKYQANLDTLDFDKKKEILKLLVREVRFHKERELTISLEFGKSDYGRKSNHSESDGRPTA
ncbi:recombinase family protein [Alkalihalophilus marmarensis]|uniref:recombinase family protein n=1 Tax=Alkalihalophilus marmarensis TaxID=521377 RepID=UPI002DBA9450|nr:recombinase family protein [Alkalihalophilus marmarensis]MEC2073748.1 recombinase family protein [Alkalihalophilus marmarensis]